MNYGDIEREVITELYTKSQKAANNCAKVWFLSLILMIVRPLEGNIWDNADYVGIILFLSFGFSMVAGIYYHYKSQSAKEMLNALD